jgi:Domain of unknown function (DUF4956)
VLRHTVKTYKKMIQDFQTVNVFPTTSWDVLTNLLFAVVNGLLLSVVYRIAYKKPNQSAAFLNSLVLLGIISAIVVMVVGNSIARAFGLAGALSVIRFRTAVKDTMDMVFILLSLVLGMACGIGLNLVAVFTTIVTSVLILLLTLTNFGQPRRRYHVLQIVYSGELDIANLLSPYCKDVKLISLKDTGAVEGLEAFYHVTLRKVEYSQALVMKLHEQPSIRSINVFFDEDDSLAPAI